MSSRHRKTTILYFFLAVVFVFLYFSPGGLWRVYLNTSIKQNGILVQAAMHNKPRQAFNLTVKDNKLTEFTSGYGYSSLRDVKTPLPGIPLLDDKVGLAVNRLIKVKTYKITATFIHNITFGPDDRIKLLINNMLIGQFQPPDPGKQVTISMNLSKIDLSTYTNMFNIVLDSKQPWKNNTGKLDLNSYAEKKSWAFLKELKIVALDS